MGVVELFAALVIERHPRHQIQRVAVFGRHDVIVAGPAQTTGDIAQLGIETGCLRGPEHPVERGFKNCVVAESGKHRLARQ